MAEETGIIFLSASDRIAGPSNRFRIVLSNAIQKLAAIELMSCVIPYTWYEIGDGCYITFQEQVGGPAVQITVPSQHWEPSVLASYLGNEMTLNSPNGLTYTVTYDTTPGKYTFASTGIFRLIWPTDPADTNFMWYFLGFNAENAIGPDFTTAYAGVIESSGIGTMSYDYLQMTISPNVPAPVTTTLSRNVTYILPVNGNWLDKAYYAVNRDYESKVIFGANGENIREILIDIQPTFPVGSFSFNGVDPSFVFRYTKFLD